MTKKIIKDVSFVGLGIGVQKRVLESVATLEELRDFRDICLKAKELSKQLHGMEWEESKPIRSKICNVGAKKSYYRRAWRSRYCKQMRPGLYRVCKKYGKHGYYDTLDGGEGVVHNYWLKAKVSLYKNSLLMFSHHDDVGNVHFVTCDHNKTIAFKHAASALDFIERVPDAE